MVEWCFLSVPPVLARAEGHSLTLPSGHTDRDVSVQSQQKRPRRLVSLLRGPRSTFHVFVTNLGCRPFPGVFEGNGNDVVGLILVIIVKGCAD